MNRCDLLNVHKDMLKCLLIKYNRSLFFNKKNEKENIDDEIKQLNEFKEKIKLKIKEIDSPLYFSKALWEEALSENVNFSYFLMKCNSPSEKIYNGKLTKVWELLYIYVHDFADNRINTRLNIIFDSLYFLRFFSTYVNLDDENQQEYFHFSDHAKIVIIHAIKSVFKTMNQEENNLDLFINHYFPYKKYQ
jgi:hypothetical protein